MKKIKILTIILAMVLVTMIGFFGIYTPVQNRMEDQMANYQFTSNLNGARYIRLAPDSTAGDALNYDNYIKTKQILEQRLNKYKTQEYTIALDESTGHIVISLPENVTTDKIVGVMSTVGKFEIIDTESKEVLMNNDDVSLSSVMYGSANQSSNATTVYLNIEFTKDGTKKLEDISNKYPKTEELNTTEENKDETADTEKAKDKTITMNIDEQELMSTTFETPIKDGKIQLSIGSASTDATTINNYIERATSISEVLNSGKLPVKYNLEGNEYILPNIDGNMIIKIVVSVMLIIGIIFLAIKHKSNGLLVGILALGLISILVILIRYTNVYVSLEGIGGIALIMLLNIVLNNKILSKMKEENVKEAVIGGLKQFLINIIPICVVAITFSFITWTPINSFGMIMFWGLVLIAIYNYLVTYNILKIKAKK